MKRMAALAAAACVLASGVTAGAHWADGSVSFLKEREVIVSADVSMLDSNISRSSFVNLINKTCLFQKRSDKSFADLAVGSGELEIFQIADAAGYIKGDEHNNANPESDISRGEVAVILARLYGLETAQETAPYEDTAQLPAWCAPAVAALAEQKLFSGYEDNTFRAANTFTRAEAFTVAERLYRQVNTNAAFAGGNGTERFPFKIASADQFAHLAAGHPEYFYEQTADIDLSAYSPYASQKYKPIDFQGTYDGGGHRLANFDPKRGTQDKSGLFLKISGTVRNVNLADISVSALKTAGGLCAENAGVIENCTVTGSVFSEEAAGGIAGVNLEAGRILGCVNNGAVEANGRAGGIAGENTGAVESCENRGKVTARWNTASNAGGIAGLNEKGASVTKSANAGEGLVRAAGYGGGIAGENKGMIEACRNEAQVEGVAKKEEDKPTFDSSGRPSYSRSGGGGLIGGICGRSSGTVSKACNKASLSAEGGIVGYNTGKLEDCYNSGNLYIYSRLSDLAPGRSPVSGGLCGTCSGEAAAVLRCYNVGYVYIGPEKPAEGSKPAAENGILMGGLIGSADKNASYESLYFLIDSPPYRPAGIQTDGLGSATLKSAAQMKSEQTFQGFDFETVWRMGDDAYPYPVLRD